MLEEMPHWFIFEKNHTFPPTKRICCYLTKFNVTYLFTSSVCRLSSGAVPQGGQGAAAPLSFTKNEKKKRKKKKKEEGKEEKEGEEEKGRKKEGEEEKEEE